MRSPVQEHKGKFLGQGNYGIIRDNGNGFGVTKIAKEADIDETDMPWEFCMANETNSPYIAKVRPKSNKNLFFAKKRQKIFNIVFELKNTLFWRVFFYFLQFLYSEFMVNDCHF